MYALYTSAIHILNTYIPYTLFIIIPFLFHILFNPYIYVFILYTYIYSIIPFIKTNCTSSYIHNPFIILYHFTYTFYPHIHALHISTYHMHLLISHSIIFPFNTQVPFLIFIIYTFTIHVFHHTSILRIIYHVMLYTFPIIHTIQMLSIYNRPVPVSTANRYFDNIANRYFDSTADRYSNVSLIDTRTYRLYAIHL